MGDMDMSPLIIKKLMGHMDMSPLIIDMSRRDRDARCVRCVSGLTSP